MAKLLENEYDNQFNTHKNAVKFELDERLTAKSLELYQDKPFQIEYKLHYIFSQFIGYVSSFISFATAVFAVAYVLNSTVGAWLGYGVGVLLCGLFEAVKGAVWRTTIKAYNRYRNVGVMSVLMLVGLHLFSLGSSGFGAYVLPLQFQYQPTEHLADSTKQKELANLDAQIQALQAQTNTLNSVLINPQTGKKSSSTAKSLGANNAQIQALQAQKNTILQALETDKATHAQQQLDAANTHAANMQFQQYSSLVAAVIFEVLYMVCMLFQFYFLYRVYVDTTGNDLGITRQSNAGSNVQTTLTDTEQTDTQTPFILPVNQPVANVDNQQPHEAPKAHVRRLKRPAVAQPQPPKRSQIGFKIPPADNSPSSCATANQHPRKPNSKQLRNSCATVAQQVPTVENQPFSTIYTQQETPQIFAFSICQPMDTTAPKFALVRKKMYLLERAKSNATANAQRVKQGKQQYKRAANSWAQIVEYLKK